MKRSILMLLVMSAALIFFGCEKETIQAPGSDQNIQEESALKGAKAKRTFEGICSPVSFIPDNTWYDAMDDWRVTGTSIWVADPDDPSGLTGTAELIVDAKNPHEENRGKWEMTWTFDVFEIAADFKSAYLVGTVEGIGVEGKVNGMKANWTYTMNFVGDVATDFPSLTNPTCVYIVEGNIEKPQGPIKKN